MWWITGLAGVGKSTLARLLRQRLLERGHSAVLLDGDTLRATLFPEAGHERADRLALALRYGNLCGMLADQGQHVVIATVSLFPEVWAANRRRFARYHEVYVHAPQEVLAGRKPHLYGPATHSDRGPVMGVDIPATEPTEAHLRVLNDGRRPPLELVDEILSRLGADTPRDGP